MAIYACQQSMCAQQRESIQVIADFLVGYLPALYRVAVFAIRSELPAVNVSVTVCTMLAHIFENETGVALRAADLLMHAAEWESGVVVVELRIRANRFPTRVGVTLLA